MEELKNEFKIDLRYLGFTVIAIIIGAISGLAGALFGLAIKGVTTVRLDHPWIIFLLPFGGILITLFYKYTSNQRAQNTNDVILAARNEEGVEKRMAFQIFIGTTFSHLLGASVGREGAALQLGGSIGYNAAKAMKIKDKHLDIMVMAGMAGAFSALLGLPLTAAIFAIEIASVGQLQYAALIPVVSSSLTASFIANLLHAPKMNVGSLNTVSVNGNSILLTVIGGILISLAAILFMYSLRFFKELFEKIWKNPLIRGFAGGIIIIISTLIIGLFSVISSGKALTFSNIINVQTYNGASGDLIALAVAGTAPALAFILKIYMTSISLGAGFKGGAIVPSFVIGSTSGCLLGHLLGVDPGLMAACGLGAFFAGVTNCPISALLLCFELFGMKGMPYFLITIAFAFIFSNKISIYPAQEYKIDL